MKKLISFLLVFCLLLSVAIFPATALTPKKYHLVFEEDFDNKLTYLRPWWDPNNTLAGVGHEGSVSFSMGRLSLGNPGTTSFIAKEGSEAAAGFKEGIVQMDLTWNAPSDGSASFSFDMGMTKDGEKCDLILSSTKCYIRRNNNSLVDCTSGEIGVKEPGFKTGHTYRVWLYLDLDDVLTHVRVHAADITDGKEPTKDAIYFIGKTSTNTILTDIQDTTGRFLRFRSSRGVESIGIDNLKFYVEDAVGEKTEDDIIPGFHEMDAMSDQELLEFLGGPTVAEIKATQKLNGEHYNLIFTEDFENGNSDPCWDADLSRLGRPGRYGEILFENGELVIGTKARQGIASDGKGVRAAAFSRGIIDFDMTWEGDIGEMNVQVIDHKKATKAFISIRQDRIMGQHYSGGRNMSVGAEGVTIPNFVVGQKYNIKIFAEKQPEQNDVMWKVYVAEYNNGKLGKYTLAGWGCHGQNLYNYAGGGFLQFAEAGGKGKVHIDNLNIYEPADSNVTGDSVKITDIIPDYNELEAGIEAGREAYKDTEGIRMLERIGMIIGEGDGVTESYLATRPTRVQAAVLTLRLRGLEEEAKAFEGDDNFSDIEHVGWAKNILAYIKAHPELGMVGVGDNCFDPMAPITQQAYVKILLEAMGYKYNEDFSWGEVLSFAKEKGMDFEEVSEFNVREVAKTTNAALYTPMKDAGAKILFAKIISDREGINDPDYANSPALTEEYKQMLYEAKHKDYGYIWNDDGGDALYDLTTYTVPGGEKRNDETMPEEYITPETLYAYRFTPQFDPDAPKDIKGITTMKTLSYCTASDGSLGHYIKSFPDNLPELSPFTVQNTYVDELIAKTGKDNLDYAIEFARNHEMPILLEVRMNDNHDGGRQENELCTWKQNHLDKLMCRLAERDTLGFGNRSWANMDFTYPECREALYTVVKNIVQNYDVDGVVLDFFRHLCFFKEVVMGEKVYAESIEKMNDLMRAIRHMVNQEGMKRGKALPIMIVIPDSLPYCYNVGLDIQTWIDEGLIDIASTGGYWNLSAGWEEAVDYFQNKHDIPFYCTLEHATVGTCRNYEQWRVEAALAWKSGAKGIRTLDVLGGNEDILRFLGDPEKVGDAPEGYTRISFNLAKGKYYPSQWIRDGVPFLYKEAFPEDWSNWNRKQKLYSEMRDNKDHVRMKYTTNGLD